MPAISFKKNWVINIFFLAVLVIVFPRFFYSDLASGESMVDNGWVWALKFFVTHNNKYIWGKDVIYTYGPLGIFSTRYFPVAYSLCQLALDVYVLFNLVVIFRIIKKQAGYNFLPWLFLFSLLVAIWEISLFLEILNLIFLILIFKDEKLYKLSGFVFFNAVLLIYIKLNTLLSTLFIVITLLTLLIKYKKYSLIAVSLVLFVALNIFIVHAFNIDLMRYISTSMEVIVNYSYAMYYFSSDYRAPLYIGILFTIVVLVTILYTWLNHKQHRFNLFRIMVIGNIVLLYFLLFKQGFTRLDEWHFNQYHSLVPLVLFSVLLLNGEKKTLLLIAQVAVVCSPIVMGLVVLAKLYPGVNTTLFTGPPPVFNYLQEAFTNIKSMGQKNENDKTYYGKSFDYNINQCINGSYNLNVNWHNRPAFQSIVAESAKLDSINTQYYLSDNAPDTIFYDNYTTDNRNPLWDDPQCKWVIFKKYKYRYTDALNQLVLVKRENSLAEADSLLLDTMVHFGQTVAIPSIASGIITMQATVNYTLAGKLRAAIFQPPKLNVILGLDTSANYTPYRRFISPLHNNRPLIINYYFAQQNNAKFIPLMDSFNIVKPNVKTFKFFTDMRSGVVGTIKLKLYRVVLQN